MKDIDKRRRTGNDRETEDLQQMAKNKLDF